MRIFLLVQFFFLVAMHQAQPILLQWAQQLAGNSNCVLNGRGIAVDAAGNVYTAGHFKGITDFDPGPGTFTLASPGNGVNAYVCKLDPQGNFIWARAFYGGTPTPTTPTLCVAYDLAVDGSGNVYTTGRFYGQVDFDPGPGTFSLASPGNPSIFVCKLDVLGNFAWVRQLGGATDPDNSGNGIAVDAAGNAHVTGRLNDDITIAKLDGLGNFTWTLSLAGVGVDFGKAIVLDQNANIYTTGELGGACDFDPGPNSYSLIPSGPATFIYKLDPSGGFVWAGQLSGAAAVNTGIDLDVDVNGNVYTIGQMGGSIAGITTDMDPGPGTFPMARIGIVSSYVVKLNANGTFAWAKQFGANYVHAYSLVLDANANIYSSGKFTGNTDFDPGPATYNINNSPLLAFNDYLLELDNTGNFIRVQVDSGYFLSSLAIDLQYIYGTGFWGGLAGFNEGPVTYTINSIGADAFVYKKALCAPGPSLTVSSSNSLLCAGETAWLNAFGALTYTWLPGGNGSMVLVNPTVTTTYTLVGNDADGCYNKQSFTQLVDQCAGISSNAQNTRSYVYPNPNTGKFQLHLFPGTAQYELYNAEGKLLEHGVTDQGFFDFSDRHYGKSVYCLHLQASEEHVFVKFIME